MTNAGILLAWNRRLIFGGPVIALWLTGKSLPVAKWEISGSLLLSLLCSALVRHCHRLLVGLVDWCANLFVWLVCCQIILMASSQGSQLICRSLAIHLLDLPPLPPGRMRPGVYILLDLDPNGGTDSLVMSPLFLKGAADVLAPRLSVVFRQIVRLGSFPASGRQQCHSYSEAEGSTVVLCCRLPADIHNISIV